MQVDRLRLAGFKSFVDPTELTIEPGLTGIVGPNGCGKSNLVEALRWVMGEASARRLRGGEMDDVIFAGSATRPARNVAEVSLTLDNTTRGAAFAFNDRDAIEVVRRIERSSGSAYRINGHEARARDVQPALRRRRDRGAFGRSRQPGPHRRADQRQTGGAAGVARRGGRDRRALPAPPRGRAEAQRRRGQSAARRRCRRDDDATTRRAQTPGAPGATLPQFVGANPPHRSAALGGALARCAAQANVLPPNCARARCRHRDRARRFRRARPCCGGGGDAAAAHDRGDHLGGAAPHQPRPRGVGAGIGAYRRRAAGGDAPP